MQTPFRLVPLALVALLLGCGSSDGSLRPLPADHPPPAPAARAELAARAAAAQDLVAVSHYTFRQDAFSSQATGTAGGNPAADETDNDHTAAERTVRVVRAADGSWRVDIQGAALSGAADVAMVFTDDQLYHCAQPPSPQPAACVAVEQLSEPVDPLVHRVFTSWLDVLTNRAAAVSVATAARLPEVSGDCFSVQPSAASLLAPLAAGVYCYDQRGLLTGADLDLGTLRLVSTDPEAPASVALPGPVVDGEPLPLVAPSPRPTPTRP